MSATGKEAHPMTKLSCALCGGRFDSRILAKCHECGAYLCPGCQKIFSGYCGACFDAGADHPEWF